MADLVRVKDKHGNETRVSADWLTRWPDDFRRVSDKTATAAKKTPAGDKVKEK
jgi:hypothetical protein